MELNGGAAGGDEAAPVRVLGRLGDLQRRAAAAGEQRLADVVGRWSLAINHEWLVDGVRAGAPFLQVSTAAPGSVLAWEIEQLRAEGCVRAGPFWVPVAWLADAERYRRLVRLVAEHALALPGSGEAHYVPKTRHELEPLLALWPHVLLLPTSAPLSIDEMMLARAWPVHGLGVVQAPTWGDGRWLSPAEFFCHDLDHARFKVREDLRARGLAIPDAYVGGTTWDAAAGAHRTFVAAALPHADASGWATARARERRVAAWLAAIAAEPRRELAGAARWLLFELVHEKSLPIDGDVLAAALADDAHVRKLQSKCATGFFGANAPAPAVRAQLMPAREWLREQVGSQP